MYIYTFKHVSSDLIHVDRYWYLFSTEARPKRTSFHTYMYTVYMVSCTNTCRSISQGVLIHSYIHSEKYKNTFERKSSLYKVHYQKENIISSDPDIYSKENLVFYNHYCSTWSMNMSCNGIVNKYISNDTTPLTSYHCTYTRIFAGCSAFHTQSNWL